MSLACLGSSSATRTRAPVCMTATLTILTKSGGQLLKDGGGEGVDVLFGGVEGGHPANLSGLLVPGVEPEPLLQPLGDVLGQDREHRVGLGAPDDLDAGHRPDGRL